MRGRAGSVTEISVFPTGISVSVLEISSYQHFIPVTGKKVTDTMHFRARTDITELSILSLCCDNSYMRTERAHVNHYGPDGH